MKSLRYFKDPTLISDKSKQLLWNDLASRLHLDPLSIRKHVFIPIYGGLGDSIPALVYAKYIVQIHNVKQSRIYFIICSTKKELPSIFNITGNYKFSFMEYSQIKKYAPLSGFYGGSFLFYTKSFIMSGLLEPLLHAHSIPFVDTVKAAFHLPLKIPYAADLSIDKNSALQEIGDTINHFDVSKKHIILFPFSSFGKRIPSEQWELLSNLLLQAGYCVFTNVANKSLCTYLKSEKHSLSAEYNPIPKTIPLSISLNALSFLFKRFNCIPIHSQGGIAYLTALLPSPARFMIYDNSISYPRSDLTSCSSPGDFISPHNTWDSFSRNMPGKFIEVYNNDDFCHHIASVLQKLH